MLSDVLIKAKAKTNSRPKVGDSVKIKLGMGGHYYPGNVEWLRQNAPNEVKNWEDSRPPLPNDIFEVIAVAYHQTLGHNEILAGIKNHKDHTFVIDIKALRTLPKLVSLYE